MSKYKLTAVDGSKSYCVGDVLELVARNREGCKLLEELFGAMESVGIFIGGVWETKQSSNDDVITDRCYTLPVFLPKDIQVKVSEFDKKQWDKFHGKGKTKNEAVERTATTTRSPQGD